jgi:hypothetical protein
MIKALNNFKGYLVSDDGKVFSCWEQVAQKGFSKGFKTVLKESIVKELKPSLYKGYQGVYCYKDGKQHRVMIHRAVIENFGGEKPRQCNFVLHVDNNILNNHINNLRWGTAKENSEQMVRDNRQTKGKDHWNYRITEEQRDMIKNTEKRRGNFKELGERLGISRCTIYKIRQGK